MQASDWLNLLVSLSSNLPRGVNSMYIEIFNEVI